jgi:hypothetical protein
MELHLRREQKTKQGLISSGPVEFVLHAQLILTNEETKLAELYKGCLPTLYYIESGSEDTPNKSYDIYSFIKGVEFKERHIAIMSNLEDRFRKIPDMLKLHFKLAKEWNGADVIKFDIT